MQALIEIIVGFVAMLAAAALSQFGLDMDTSPKPQREIHRVRDDGCKEHGQRTAEHDADGYQG